jgi:hypothetical protein
MKASGCRWIVGTALVFLAVTSGALAADLTFFVGGAIPGKLSADLLAAPGTTYRDLSNSPIFGIRLNTNIVPMIGLEHTLAYSTDYLSPKSILLPSSNRGFVYNTNLMINIPIKKVVPYGTVGVGLIRQYGSAVQPIGTKLALNYGVGLKLQRLLGPLGLRVDFRGYRAMNIVFITSKQSLNIFEASAGLLITFGSR